MRAILTYHSIDDSGSVISMNPEFFRAHLSRLASSPVRVVPLSEIADGAPETDAVALTFDDGFANFETEALPELERWGFPSTVFVVSGKVGTTNRWGGRSDDGIPELPLMGWDAVARTADRGVEIGAHTMTHAWLPGLEADEMRDELEGSAEAIERETGRPARSFAYPYGGFSSQVVAEARARFERACTTMLRPLRDREDSLLLPRLDAYYFRSPGALDGWGGPEFRWRLRVLAGGRKLRSLIAPSDRPSNPVGRRAAESVGGRP